MIRRRETTKVHAQGVVPDLPVSVGAGDGNRTRYDRLEEGSPQGWEVLVVLAELAPSNPSRSAPCRTPVARLNHDGPRRRAAARRAPVESRWPPAPGPPPAGPQFAFGGTNPGGQPGVECNVARGSSHRAA